MVASVAYGRSPLAASTLWTRNDVYYGVLLREASMFHNCYETLKILKHWSHEGPFVSVRRDYLLIDF